MPKVPGIHVVRSPIHGYGVFAAKAFAEGEEIAKIDGVSWRAGDDVDDRYSLWIQEGLFFDMVDQTRFINHSCDPNAGVESGLSDDGQVWATVIAMKPIAIGEEISYDYAFPPSLAEPCRCGAAICRGLIIDEDALPPAAPPPRRRRKGQRPGRPAAN
jgi:SET domain-containing protein